MIDDPLEQIWPPIGRLMIEDAETGESFLTAKAHTILRERYANSTKILRQNRNALLSRSKVDRVYFRTDLDYIKPLINFFRERSIRYRR